MQVTWLLSQYGLENNHISVGKNGKTNLLKMKEEADDGNLIAIYLPLKKDPDSGGCIIGVVKIIPLEENNSIENYGYVDPETGKNWPYGLPCKVIKHFEKNPINLREINKTLKDKKSFTSLVSSFWPAPKKLSGNLKEKIEEAVFARL